MYTMMNTTGSGLGVMLFYGLHMLSIVVFAFGAAFLLFWAFKHLSERKLWQWGWTLVVIGTIACLLTLPAWPSFAMMGGFWGMGYNTQGMMRDVIRGTENNPGMMQ